MARKKETLDEAFGKILRSLRVKAGVSQEQLGHMCHLHRTFVSLLERGQRCPSLKTIAALAEALDVRPFQLVRMVEDRLR